MKLLDVFLIATAGYIIGVLIERWSYFYKTGYHLQDLKKCQHKNKNMLENENINEPQNPALIKNGCYA